MVVYYAKQCDTVMEKLGFRGKTLAMDVDSAKGAFTCMNTNTTYAIDDIVEAKWSNNMNLKLRIQKDGELLKQRLVFECQADLYFFLVELGFQPTKHDGEVRRGSFCASSLSSSGTAKSARRSI
ncbi:hypothetical protein ACHHYP_03300 [Achlya hypogyna]|uniref:Uncharacterized protein n=1 Tax=Achlya hypogyna TaxID=1202772 RepID=A0A1V9Z463_ACHHY|nr:hypothetical protein ACHHYP_03300 [Achlya hypogyna]